MNISDSYNNYGPATAFKNNHSSQPASEENSTSFASVMDKVTLSGQGMGRSQSHQGSDQDSPQGKQEPDAQSMIEAILKQVRPPSSSDSEEEEKDKLERELKKEQGKQMALGGHIVPISNGASKAELESKLKATSSEWQLHKFLKG